MSTSLPLIALIGNPNCGKSALFNLLTGSEQKIANYAGVTVERKSGIIKLETHIFELIDLPGIYSLSPQTIEEETTYKILYGKYEGERKPDAIVFVVDATHPLRSITLLLGVLRLKIPTMVVINFSDIKHGQILLASELTKVFGIYAVNTAAIKPASLQGLKDFLAQDSGIDSWSFSYFANQPEAEIGDHNIAKTLLSQMGVMPDTRHPSHDFSVRLDNIFLHPVLGGFIMLAILFAVFQSVYSLSEVPMGWIESATGALSEAISANIPDGLLKNLLVDGVIAGVGGVLTFLPQILILFFFIIVLEESGYLPRAALMMDRLMGSVGLSGRAFIPLLSSFACAIPGIMATRTIPDIRSRWVTVMIAPLMTCSARLPVYALLIAAFIPQKIVYGLQLQGLVLFSLYAFGVLSAMLVACAFKLFNHYRKNHDAREGALIIELPDYRLPYWRNIAIGVWQKAKIFVYRMGTTIMVLSVLLWFISNYPSAPQNSERAPIEYSYAGKIGSAIAPIFAPIGFNWQISLSLLPGMAAREVMVSSLSTVYAVAETSKESDKQIENTSATNNSGVVAEKTSEVVPKAEEDDENSKLQSILSSQWSFATSLSLLAWFVFAPMCFPTLVTVRNELASFSSALFLTFYQFGLAYLAAFLIYRLSLFLGAG